MDEWANICAAIVWAGVDGLCADRPGRATVLVSRFCRLYGVDNIIEWGSDGSE